MDFKELSAKTTSNSDNAYVYCIFGDARYIMGALTCAHSLKKTGTKFDIVCMITDDINTRENIQILETVFDSIVEIPLLTMFTKDMRTKRQMELYSSWKNMGCTKWNCLGLVKYKKVMIVDADKIILECPDELFNLSAPAGTFSSPYAENFGNKRGGMFNPYKGLNHGDTVAREMIDIGLNGMDFKKFTKSSFVLIGTMVLLEPSKDHYAQFIDMIHTYDAKNPFGYPNCNSMMDEQILVHFYRSRERIKWSFIHQKWNWVVWTKNWLDYKKEHPAVLHYFGVKPWNMSPAEWLDLNVWWKFASNMVDDLIVSNPGNDVCDKIKTMYHRDEAPKNGCFYCKLYGLKSDHNFYTEQVDCLVYLLK